MHVFCRSWFLTWLSRELSWVDIWCLLHESLFQSHVKSDYASNIDYTLTGNGEKVRHYYDGKFMIKRKNKDWAKADVVIPYRLSEMWNKEVSWLRNVVQWWYHYMQYIQYIQSSFNLRSCTVSPLKLYVCMYCLYMWSVNGTI